MLGQSGPTHWIDECDRAEDLIQPLSIHAIQLLPEFSSTDLATLQAEDADMADAYTVMHDGLHPSPDELRAFPLESRHLISQQPQIRLENGVTVKINDDRTRLVVPSTLRYHLFEMAHAGPLAAHLGSYKTAGQLKNHYFWTGLNRDVAEWCRQCPQCARSKGPPLRPHAELNKIPVGTPLDLVTMDILSGLPTTSDGSKYILVLVDAFTKWVEAYPLPNQEASTCMDAAYAGFYARFGLPLQLHSDQGHNFESTLVKELCALAGIHKTRTTPFHLRSDGLTERANRTILQMLRTTTTDHPQDWPSRLPALLSAYRANVHATTQVTPNLAMLGREVLLLCTLIAQPPHDTSVSTTYAANFRSTLRDAHQRVRASLNTSARTQKRYFDQQVKQQVLTVGQLVWMYWPLPRIRSTYRKLTKFWTGPWEILAFLSPLVVQVRHTTNQKCQTVYVDILVSCASGQTTEQPTGNQAAPVPHLDEHQNTQPQTVADYSDNAVPPSSFSSLSVNLRPRRTLRPPARYRS